MAMDKQRFVEVKSGQSWSSGSGSILKDCHRVCLTRVSLVDPASAAGQGVVVARVKSDTWNTNIPIAHLSAANASCDLQPELVLDGEFFLDVNRLEDGDSAAVDVRFDFYVFPPPAPETVDQQLSRRPWSVDLASGFTHRTFMKGRDRVCLTRVSLVDPGRAVGQGVVGACVHTVIRDRLLAPLSAERPSIELSPVVVLDKEVYFYLMWLGCRCRPADGEIVVRFEGYVLPQWSAETMEEELDDDEDEEVEVEEYYEYEEPAGFESENEDDGRQEEEEVEEEESDGQEDDGSEEEESDGEVDGQEDTASGAVDDVMHRTNFVPEQLFVGGQEPQFASAGSTAGFMRVAAVESQEDGDDKEILVFYRYTRFSTVSDGAVEACRHTKKRQLRFIMPPTGDTARSLPWAGASLANLVYPGGHLRKDLQELWSNLIAEVSVRPRAARVEVLVDVGILRRADCTQDSMERMRAALEGKVQEGWPVGCHSHTVQNGMELLLPEPVWCGAEEEPDDDDNTDGGERPAKLRRVVAAADNDTDGGELPAKRRRVVAAGEDCSVCLQLLEGNDLAAWPGCGKPHVFHGRCLELVLRESDMCPICRRSLYIEPVQCVNFSPD